MFRARRRSSTPITPRPGSVSTPRSTASHTAADTPTKKHRSYSPSSSGIPLPPFRIGYRFRRALRRTLNAKFEIADLCSVDTSKVESRWALVGRRARDPSLLRSDSQAKRTPRSWAIRRFAFPHHWSSPRTRSFFTASSLTKGWTPESKSQLRIEVPTPVASTSRDHFAMRPEGGRSSGENTGHFVGEYRHCDSSCDRTSCGDDAEHRAGILGRILFGDGRK